MSELVSESLIGRLRNRFVAVLDRDLTEEPENPGQSQKVDAQLVGHIFVWQLLVPFFLGWASSISLEALRKRVRSVRTAEEAKQEIQNTVGKRRRPLSPSRAEQLLRIVRVLLVEYGVSPAKAEQVACVLSAEASRELPRAPRKQSRKRSQKKGKGELRGRP